MIGSLQEALASIAMLAVWQAAAAVLAVVLAAGGGLALWLTIRKTARQGPAALFGELCQAHQLTFADRRLLRHLAHARHLPDPSRLFVEPQLFEGPVIRQAFGAQADRVTALQRRLFEA
jgi:hypothetical protein